MHRTKHILQHATPVALLGLVLTASGCGAGAGAGLSGSGDPVAPKVNVGMYRDLLSYCRLSEPTGIDATRDGWMTSMFSFDEYFTASTGMVSVAGSTTAWDTPLTLFVPLAGAGGYGEPEWKMGVRFPTVLGKQSVACIRQATHTYIPRTLDVPGVAYVPASPVTVWDSYWDRALPISKLAGKAIDGFEFVSNFAPSGGEVFFNTGKSRVTAPSTLSVCYLAPKSAQWDCSQPGVADAGSTWQISVHAPKPGVYVLVAPAAPV